ncbi:predicted protein [Uncinocarpus reesii 1704]|uniref:Guanyl-nucleotide exchange factor n=1 Tax=Uncinocarpus reesii (strain UAMH 1704) TaxID=336963 RepID=C4JEE2_UNCRE|nr:uncharacterized protein UREG_00781 [Uncinocarpus reesii 1704]EEP75934.1 predicted protein [Uncinocarpus reesii 1704]
MPWKGLKIGGTGQKGGSDKTQRTDSNIPARFSDHAPRAVHSSEHIVPQAPELLSAPPQKIPSSSFDHGERKATQLESRALRAQNTKRNRFSLLRFRHASDPQLSASYHDGELPPVPAIPKSAQTPKIITTSPTTDNLDQVAKRKSIFKLSHPKAPIEKPKSAGTSPTPLTSNSLPPFPVSATAPSSVRASHISFEEPQGRLSTASLRSGPVRFQDGTHHGLLPAARVSESSRSDGSSAEHGVYNSASRTDASSSTSSFFRLPRLKKNRHSLLPFPAKIPLSGQFPKPDLHTRAMPTSSIDQDRELLSPLPSPSRSSLGRAAQTPSSPEPNLLRNNSIASAHSVRSSLSLRLSNRPTRRGRSSTIGSLADIQDDARQSSAEIVPSSRTSTFTAPRKSFSDMFSPSQRSKHQIERFPPESPSDRVPGTPQSAISKPNSFSIAREVASCPPREPDDTPGTYLSRLENTVHRAAIATILSQGADDFYKTALRKYMRSFSFFGDSMDMAIRKLLMEVELPKETQQIDRVLQGFADRYHECNPGIFASTDQAYFIAFSLLILHTDVFNKNNKRKMQKQDYVRNTRGEGLAEEILECFYDNICYTPFIHVEDEVNLGVRRLGPKSRSPLFKVAGSDHISRASRDPVDPYTLILEGKLGALRPNFKDVMDLEDVYSTSGLDHSRDMNELHQLFYKPCVLQIVSERSRPDAFVTQTSIANPAESQPGLVDIRVAKVGLLWRKDPKKKKTRSPWQEWGAVLTGSQLYFFRDVQWVKSLISQYESRQNRGRRHAVVFKPPVSDFKPDAIVSTADAVALLDSSYKKHKHAFLFVRHGGFEEVFLANSDTEMDDWISTINYAAAFRTTGVRMRGMIGANYEGYLPQKSARANSITSDTSETPTVSELALANTRRMDPRLAEEVFAARRELVSTRITEANEKLSSTQKQLEDLLQNARHLQILTPIHPRARDQVLLAAGRMAAKIKWVRLDIWRSKCHRDVLALDLEEEEKHLSVKRVPPSSTPSGNELCSVSSQERPLASESAPSLAPTSPRSNRSSKRPRSRSPTPVRAASPPDGSIERVSVNIHRPGPPKSLTASDIAAQTRKPSISGSKDDASIDLLKKPGETGLPREASVTSISGHRTPTPSVFDNEEERLLREAGILSNELLTQMSATGEAVDGSSNATLDGPIEPPSSEGRSKVRRSLHRTLREGHLIPHHQRSKKGKDSASMISTASDGNVPAETEVLPRGTGSFTLHGKKASVVTFGSEWENMSPEQRLKQRKPIDPEDSHPSGIPGSDGQVDLPTSESISGKKTYSLRSVSTTTAKSVRQRDSTQEKIGDLTSPGGSLAEISSPHSNEHSGTIDADSVIIEEEEDSHEEPHDPPVQPATAKEQFKNSTDEPEESVLTSAEMGPAIHDTPLQANRIVSEQAIEA